MYLLHNACVMIIVTCYVMVVGNELYEHEMSCSCFLINIIIIMPSVHFFVILVYAYVYILLLWIISMHVLKHTEQFDLIL